MVVIREMFVNNRRDERRTTEGTRKSILGPLLNEHTAGKTLAEANIQANLQRNFESVERSPSYEGRFDSEQQTLNGAKSVYLDKRFDELSKQKHALEAEEADITSQKNKI